MGLNRILYCLFLVAFTLGACAISKRKDAQEQREEDPRVSDSSIRPTTSDASVRPRKDDAGGNDNMANGGAGTPGYFIVYGQPVTATGDHVDR